MSSLWDWATSTQSRDSMSPHNIQKICFSLLFVFFSQMAKADFPDHPVKLVVPFTPAGAVDGIARLFSADFGKNLGQPVLVENKPGSGGTIGITAVTSAAPDGYTLLLGNIATASAPALYPKAGVNTKLLDPVILIGRSAYVLAVRNDFPVKSLSELIALAKSRPGKYNYASAGSGSAIHLAAELFKAKAGVDIVHVPYKGAGPAVNALLAGDVELMFGSISELRQQFQVGRLRALGVTSIARSSALSDVPSISELGLKDYDVTGWYGIYAPKNIPQDILKKLQSIAQITLSSPNVQLLLKQYEMEPSKGTPSEASEILEGEVKRWSEVIHRANIIVE
jgi:tripartite-type tricarboxylate transporter receptor subunit TctC